MDLHFQTEFCTFKRHDSDVKGWYGVETMMLKTIVGINGLILLQNLGKTGSECDVRGLSLTSL